MIYHQDNNDLTFILIPKITSMTKKVTDDFNMKHRIIEIIYY